MAFCVGVRIQVGATLGSGPVLRNNDRMASAGR
jgi:hypothetical protein